MVTVELVTQYDLEYAEVCAVASRIYWEKLGIVLNKFPSAFIEMFEGGAPVGGCGLRYGVEEPEFLTEKYCIGIDLSDFFPGRVVPPRLFLGEICCGHLEKTRYRCLSLIPPPQLFQCAHTAGIQFLFVTSSLPVKRLFDSLGTRLISICKADINKAGYSPTEYEMWKKGYFRLNPVACLIDVEQALQTYRERCARNPELLPPFRLGERLAAVLDTQRASELVAAWV